MRLREFWAGQESELPNGLGDNEPVSKDPDLKYKESRWTPEKGRDPWLNLYEEEVIQSVINGLAKNCNSNLTKGEEQAIMELMNDDDIIIRPVDKGSGVVVMGAADYFKNFSRR